MSYDYTDDMGEISGFGGEYEAACRAMVIAGLTFWDEHPELEPRFKGFKDVYGILMDDNEDAKKLSNAITTATDDCTGAMHQAAVCHVMAAHRLGWPEYQKQMRERKSCWTKKEGA